MNPTQTYPRPWLPRSSGGLQGGKQRRGDHNRRKASSGDRARQVGRCNTVTTRGAGSP